ncbi:TorD/DmsD family molecular chaperone [Eggerthella lenta]|uniref:TorD/DmsD family molecular chaperone n=1 Tax=Eggerthella lenta TaxID=84112 RepID=UPI00215DABC7|nr:molecular chaperone TorD family protein [Eggerthella lenta]
MPDTACWMNKAALYELLASAFCYPSEEVASALASGEFAEAFQEIGAANGVDERHLEERAEALRAYVGRGADAVLHALRREHTRLFIGHGSTLISPYAGVWDSVAKGKKPMLMVGAESMAIERFMRRCGVGQPEGTNEPLDHAATLLEFMYYLCLVKADAVKPSAHADVRDGDYRAFFDEHLAKFAAPFADEVMRQTTEPFFASSAWLLRELVA